MSSVIDITMDRSAFDAFTKSFLGKRGMTSIVYGITNAARDRWVELADAELGSSRAEYLAALQATRIEGTRGIVELIGAFANMIESGAAPFDMRDTMLRPFGLRHRVVPFRHTGPDTTGKSGVGTPMGSAYQAALGPKGAKALGRALYAAAKTLKPGEALGPGSAPLLKPHHQADVYAGMQRFAAPKGRGGSYMTFRTISEDSAAESWLHPGLSARNLSAKLSEELPAIADKVLSEILDGLTGG